jgi:hypothetical protein
MAASYVGSWLRPSWMRLVDFKGIFFCLASTRDSASISSHKNVSMLCMVHSIDLPQPIISY